MKDNNEIIALVDGIKKQLTNFYSGDSWVTDNFSKKVLSIKSADALKKVQGHSHSVAQSVSHITAWRNFAVQKLSGNDDYDILNNSTEDWPQADDWDSVQSEFKTCDENLMNAIENFPVESWSSEVPGRTYSFIYLLTGIIEHDYYHYGQIGSLLAAVKMEHAGS